LYNAPAFLLGEIRYTAFIIGNDQLSNLFA